MRFTWVTARFNQPGEFKSDKEGDHQKKMRKLRSLLLMIKHQPSTLLLGDQAGENAVSDNDSTNLNKGLEEQEIEKY